jgi:hypothetical protein
VITAPNVGHRRRAHTSPGGIPTRPSASSAGGSRQRASTRSRLASRSSARVRITHSSHEVPDESHGTLNRSHQITVIPFPPPLRPHSLTRSMIRVCRLEMTRRKPASSQCRKYRTRTHKKPGQGAGCTRGSFTRESRLRERGSPANDTRRAPAGQSVILRSPAIPETRSSVPPTNHKHGRTAQSSAPRVASRIHASWRQKKAATARSVSAAAAH